MAAATVAINLFKTLNIQRNIAAEVTLGSILVNFLTKFSKFLLRKLPGTLIFNTRVNKNSFGSGVANAIDVLKRKLNSLLVGNFNSANTSSLNFKRHSPESLEAGSSCGSSYGSSCSETFIASDSLHGIEHGKLG
jgi:hypothetical protein